MNEWTDGQRTEGREGGREGREGGKGKRAREREGQREENRRTTEITQSIGGQPVPKEHSTIVFSHVYH